MKLNEKLDTNPGCTSCLGCLFVVMLGLATALTVTNLILAFGGV